MLRLLFFPDDVDSFFRLFLTTDCYSWYVMSRSHLALVVSGDEFCLGQVVVAVCFSSM